MSKNFSTNTYIHQHQECTGARRVIFIDVEASCPAYLLQPEDQCVPGGYFIDVPATMDDNMAATCALVGFHSQIAIQQLWRFDYTFYDVETDDVLDPFQVKELFDFASHAGTVTSTKETCLVFAD